MRIKDVYESIISFTDMLEINKVAIFVFFYSKVCVGGAGREE